MRLLQKEQEGRAETGGEGSCQWLGKLVALHKRLSLCESSQGAAIIPAKQVGLRWEAQEGLLNLSYAYQETE